jgi:hypothetical protein
MKEYLLYLTPIGTLFAFIFTVIKYFHTQKLSEKNRRFENYQKVFILVTGRTNEGIILPDTSQAMGIYQLSEFPEYAYMSIPIIEYYLKMSEQKKANNLFRKALLETKQKLEKNCKS